MSVCRLIARRGTLECLSDVASHDKLFGHQLHALPERGPDNRFTRASRQPCQPAADIGKTIHGGRNQFAGEHHPPCSGVHQH